MERIIEEKVNWMFELFSRRHAEKNGKPEVFIYDSFPKEFRNQFYAIVKDVFTPLNSHNAFSYWESVCEHFAREKGLKNIVYHDQYRSYYNNQVAFEYYVDTCSDIDFLDLMDYVFFIIDHPNVRKQAMYYVLKDISQDAIDELNVRLKQHSLGYEFCNGQIIKKTNTVTHETIIKPALNLLCDEDFHGAEEEYMLAWKHYKKGENKDAIVNAEKAFESTMKIICTKLKYSFDKDRDDANKLLSILKNNDFFPNYLESHLNALITTLSSGAPTVRNRTSGHGQGNQIKNIRDYYTAYVLNLVASNIVLLYSFYKEK